MDELRLAWRRLMKRPASTLTSISTLACAIGAAAVTWTTISAVLLDPRPVRAPNHLFVVGTLGTSGRNAGILQTGLVYPYLAQIRDSGVFESTAAAWGSLQHLLVDHGDGALKNAAVGFVSHEYFEVLGVRLALGRPFQERDDRRGAPPVALVSHRYWQRELRGGDVVGRTITINRRAVVVTGIIERRFRGLSLADAPDLYLPFHTIGDVAASENYFAEANVGRSPTAGTVVIGRGRTDNAAEVTAHVSSLPPLGSRTSTLAAGPLTAEAIPAAARTGMRQFSTLLAATVGLLVLIGSATVGMLLLVRTESRREEFAMCLALGAPRARLAKGIALEGALLTLGGSLLALPAALWMFALIRGAQLPGGVAVELLDLTLDRGVLAAVIGTAAASMLGIIVIARAFGFRADLGSALRARSGATPRVSRRRTRAVLVTLQVAVTLFLLTGAALLARSLMAALALNPGYDPAHLVSGAVALGPYGYTPERATTFLDEFGSRIRRHPTVQSIAFHASAGGMGGAMPIDGVSRQFPRDVSFMMVDAEYFSTVGMPLVAGRPFAASDSAQAPPVGIVSQSLARLIADGGSAIGKRITMPYRRPPAAAPQILVIGVVPDVITSVATLEPLTLYRPVAQQDRGTGSAFMIRAADPDAARREVLAALRAIDPAVTPAPMYTMQERLGRQMAAQRFGATVLGTLGGVAVLLTLLGTYVLADSMAAVRMREMGIRAALGATGPQLGRIVVADTARLVAIGIVAGLGIAWIGANTVRGFLFRVEPLDPVTLAATSTLTLVLALAVTLRAAIGVARVDLSSVLKTE